jgi:putative acetyltransferase
MSPSEITLRAVDPTSPEAAELLAALDTFQSALYPPESTHLLPAVELKPPRGMFLGAFAGTRLVGCCGYVLRDGYAELKRLFVHPDARGARLGERLLRALEDEARRAGVPVLRLETGVAQPASVRTCERAGFARRGPFGDYRADPLSVFMEKRLGE